MTRASRFRIVSPRGWLLSTAGLLALLSTCHDPARPPAGAIGSNVSYDAATGTVSGRIDSPDDDLAPLDLVATQVEFDAANERLHVWMSIRNPGADRTPAPDGIFLQSFDPREVAAVNALAVFCPEQPPVELCGGSLFVHRGTFGGDRWLDPGEISAPVEWIFHDPGGGSFSFAARPRVLDGASISGTVFEDRNADGRRQMDEPGIDRASVDVEGPGMERIGALADEAGHWTLEVRQTGVYSLRLSVFREDIQACEPTTPIERQVRIVRRDDGSLADAEGFDYGCHPVPWPPSFTVRGFVYFDRDADGRRGAGEPAFLNVGVGASEAYAVACFGHPQEDVANDARGYELVLPVDCCPTWRIDCDRVRGFEAMTPRAVWVESPKAGSVVHMDFGMTRSEPFEGYVVRGVVYQDVDSNGVRDSSEPGIAGVTVRLSAILCGVTSVQGTTDASGAYEIGARALGCPLPWLVGLDLPDDLRDTTPDLVSLDAAPPGAGNTYIVDFGVAALDLLEAGAN